MLRVEVARGAEKSRRAAPRRWTVSGEGEGERHLEAARARLVVLREAARAELELAADLGILREAAVAELELAADLAGDRLTAQYELVSRGVCPKMNEWLPSGPRLSPAFIKRNSPRRRGR